MPSGADHSRLTSVTYADGYVLTYNYASGLNDSISRLSSLSDTTGTLEAYSYLGLGTVVVRAHPQPNVDLSYAKRSGEGVGDAGDQYTGLDRFGRVVDQRWLDPTTGIATDRFQYGYDAAGNRTFRDNLVSAAFGEVYTYDGLDQLASFDRGTLNGGRTAITGAVARSQGWATDAVGNFTGVTTNGTTQTRTANAQNEITAVGGATTPTYDANGNMTGDETGRQFGYDAWNRLVVVKNSGGTTMETFAYDGLNRRVTQAAGGTTTDLYYSAAWQVLTEKVGSATTVRYVWSPVYVDALVLRDRDTNADGTITLGTDERLWVQQDANWNVTALVDGSGAVVERYAYDPYGVQTVYNASWSSIGSSANSWTQGFQGLFYDATAGLNPAQERWYSPTLGRWVTMDPIRFTGGDVNLYGFVGNNPSNGTDPAGTTLYVTGADADVWKQKFGQYVTLVPAGNGSFRIDILPAGRQGNAFHAAAANYLGTLGIVGEGDTLAQTLIILFDGDVSQAHPEYNHDSDRLLVRPPGDRGKIENYRLLPLWAQGLGPVPPPVAVVDDRPWWQKTTMNVIISVGTNAQNGAYTDAAWAGLLVGGSTGFSVGSKIGVQNPNDPVQGAAVGGVGGGGTGAVLGCISGFAASLGLSVAGTVVTGEPYILNPNPAFLGLNEAEWLGASVGGIAGFASGAAWGFYAGFFKFK